MKICARNSSLHFWNYVFVRVCVFVCVCVYVSVCEAKRANKDQRRPTDDRRWKNAQSERKENETTTNIQWKHKRKIEEGEGWEGEAWEREGGKKRRRPSRDMANIIGLQNGEGCGPKRRKASRALGSILGPFCAHFGPKFGRFWIDVGSILWSPDVASWDHCWCFGGVFFVSFGSFLGC